MTTKTEEPPDHHEYDLIVPVELRDFLVVALRSAEAIIAQDLAALEQDEDLRAILGKPKMMTFAAGRVLGRMERQRDRLERADSFGDNEYLLRTNHGFVRLMKSAGIMHLEDLQQRRNRLAERPRMSRDVLQAVDQQLSKLRARLEAGPFGSATPLEILAFEAPTREQPTASAPPPLKAGRPRPVVLDSIGILDDELRSRCLDLLEQFHQDGQPDRLDTVITEATRIFEHRLRTLSGAEPTCVGVELASFAFNGDPPRIELSSVEPEQKAGHLLFRGVFGFIRNQHHHRLIGPLIPERVLEIVAMLDYLIFLAESGQRRVPAPAGAA